MMTKQPCFHIILLFQTRRKQPRFAVELQNKMIENVTMDIKVKNALTSYGDM
jgi:hypothetical protein